VLRVAFYFLRPEFVWSDQLSFLENHGAEAVADRSSTLSDKVMAPRTKNYNITRSISLHWHEYDGLFRMLKLRDEDVTPRLHDFTGKMDRDPCHLGWAVSHTMTLSIVLVAILGQKSRRNRPYRILAMLETVC